jgi:uncharacterized membrane protein YcaP (DUF421 family)
MLKNLMDMSLPAENLIIRAAVVFFFVLLLLRISGKRQLGQMGATEFVAVLLISNAVQNSMNGGDNSLSGGLLLATVLIVMSWAISYFTFRSRTMRVLFEGTPRLVIHKGHMITKALKKERLTIDELKGLLRRQGIHLVSEVYSGVLESDGALSVIRNEEVGKPVPVIEQGPDDLVNPS